MPESVSPPIEERPAKRAPLKRGDACTNCKLRKIRCTAEKPACKLCVNTHKTCVYPSLVPGAAQDTDRRSIARMRKKIDELEGIIKQAGLGHRLKDQDNGHVVGGDALHQSRRSSDEKVEYPVYGHTDVHQLNGSNPAIHFQGMAVDNPVPPMTSDAQQQYLMNNPLPALIPETTAPPLPNPQLDPSLLAGLPLPDPPAPPRWPWETAMDSSPDQASAGPSSGSGPSPFQAGQGMVLDPLVTDPYNVANYLPKTVSPANGSTLSGPSVQSGPSSVSGGQDSLSFMDFSVNDLASGFESQSFMGGGYRPAFPIHCALPKSGHPSNHKGNGRKIHESCSTQVPSGLDVLGRIDYFTEDSLPAQAISHLLDLFFSQRRLYGLVLHVPRFYASLHLPVHKRPHPSLLNAMYLMAAPYSEHESIRGLESYFYATSRVKLDDAVSADRLLDAIRASILLIAYLYAKGKYAQAWSLSGYAVKLAQSCGLHQLNSSVWQPSAEVLRRSDNTTYNEVRSGFKRSKTRTYFLIPPEDQVDLGERIYTFWSLFILDRCGATAFDWPVSLEDDSITTPFPRPLWEYELGLTTKADDITVDSVWQDRPPTLSGKDTSQLPDDGPLIRIIKASIILEQAGRLYRLPTEEGSVAILPDGSTPKNLTARDRTPKATRRIEEAIARFEVSWPVEAQGPTVDGQDMTIHSMILQAKVLCCESLTRHSENLEGIAHGRRLIAIIRMLGGEMQLDLSSYLVVAWSAFWRLFSRAARTLRRRHDFIGAAVQQDDADFMLQAIRNLSSNVEMATDMAEGLQDRARREAEIEDSSDDEDCRPSVRLGGKGQG